MSAPTIDTATFRELQETAGADFVKELVDAFLEEAPAMLADMRSALAAGEADRFRRAAHSLKSNSNTFGASGLAALAKGLELGGLDAARSVGAQALDPVAQEFARVAAALKELRDA
jgi:HPt (histidine-containing phosphotransfer) domain-containing protein